MEMDHKYRKKEEEMIAAEKRCTDCRATKTPLWRSGPAGSKSLCNACGIRHRKRRAVASGGGASETTMKEGGKKQKYDELGVEWRQRLMAFGEGVAKYEKQRSESESEKKKKKAVKKRMGDVERAALLLMSLSESKGSSSSPVFAS